MKFSSEFKGQLEETLVKLEEAVLLLPDIESQTFTFNDNVTIDDVEQANLKVLKAKDLVLRTKTLLKQLQEFVSEIEVNE